jgi:hypothetical protein
MSLMEAVFLFFGEMLDDGKLAACVHISQTLAALLTNSF